jgi:hypothetical protein
MNWVFVSLNKFIVRLLSMASFKIEFSKALSINNILSFIYVNNRVY